MDKQTVTIHALKTFNRLLGDKGLKTMGEAFEQTIHEVFDLIRCGALSEAEDDASDHICLERGCSCRSEISQALYRKRVKIEAHRQGKCGDVS